MVDNELEPIRIVIGMFYHLFFQLVYIDKFPIFHFIGVDVRYSVKLPDQYVIDLMLDKLMVKAGFINELESIFGLHINTHFLP